MDSCNSGDVDIASSSAEEDYEDSSLASPPPLPPLPPGLFHSSFDSSSPYHLDPFFSSSNLDTMWSRKRSASSLFSPPPAGLGDATIPNSGEVGSLFTRPVEGLQPAAPKSGKKRSRASRRAPTTVLTTDTNNFRQMVQEFTGIPTPPFGSTSPFCRGPRLDFLGGSGAMLPQFLLRSFPQKSPILTPLTNYSNTNHSNHSGNLDVSASDNVAISTGFTESLPELLLPSGCQSLGGLPDSLLNLQPLMNPAPKFQFPSFLPGKPPTHGLPFLPDSILPMNVGTGILNELGNNPCRVEMSSQGNVSTQMIHPIPSVDPSRLFVCRTGGSSGSEDEVGSQQPGISIVESNPLKGGGNSCKISYGTSSAEFIHAEESGSETASRGDATIESWISSSYVPPTTQMHSHSQPRT